MQAEPGPDAPVTPSRVGRYEILDLLGEGGMGRVYRARDTELGRTVAVKVLPQAFAADRDCLRRFEQESRAAAALNHPGIMAVYDVGLHEGAPYLVTELLEGTTLRGRLEKGRLTLDQVLEFSIQVAEALATAHAKGIIHRDLKPENLFVCPGDRLKILDFGLAKLTGAGASDFDRVDVTGTSMPRAVLGTPAYMPPEQARGDTADQRADIFSLGCIIYEMLEGRRPFDGATAADVISAILKDAPASLTSSGVRPLPPALDSIVQRCLAKDLDARFHSASDLAFALRNLAHGGAAPVTGAAPAAAPPARYARRLLPWGLTLAGIAAAAAIWFGAGALREPRTKPLVTEFMVPVPTSGHDFAPMPLPGLLPTAPQIGLSPDGRQLAFVSTDDNARRTLWIRSLDVSRPRPIEGTDDVTSWPFWSPDSRYVVIAVRRALLKVDTATNSVERLCTLPDEAPVVPFVTGSWGENGAILFSIGGSTGLFRIDAAGGTPKAVTTLDKSRGDEYHSWPQLLAGGRFLLFVRTGDAASNGVYAGRLDSNQVEKIHANASRAVYSSGHLLWTLEDRLVAQPFDAATLQLSGQPFTIVPSVFQGAGRTPGFWAATSDTLVYTGGDTRERQFRWFARSGQALETVGPPGLYVTFDVSADLSQVVAEVSKDASARHSTLSLFETARGSASPLTHGDQNDSDPRFGPAGEVVFARNSRDGPGIMRLNPATRQQSTLLPRGTLPVIWMEDWAGDGSSVVYRTGASRDAWQLASGHREPQRLTDAREPIEQVQLSPDKRWIAYNTAESGQSEVFVSSVPFGGERWQVSLAGGVQPSWRADGKELYYLGLDSALYSVSIVPNGTTLRAGAPQLLFRTELPVISGVVEQYRSSGDGQRFLFCLPLTSVRREPLRMLMNWRSRVEPPADQQ